MTWSRANWGRCLCWAVAYLLFFDTLSMSALRYVPGWTGLRAASQISAAENRADGAVDPGRSWRALAGVLAVLPDLLGFGAPSAAAGRTLHVSASDATCGGNTPCFRTIQAAIDAAAPVDRVLIHPGQYPEQLRIFGKNHRAGASESDRIVIEADPAAPWGSVVVGPLEGQRCPRGAAVDIKGSSFVTLRGLVFRNAGGKGVVLRGQGPANEAIHIERNRIYADGDSRCSRGISIWHGNEKTLIANNLIDGTDREGLYVTDDRNGDHTIVSNTIYGNRLGGILLARRHRAVIANNLIIANGEERSGRRVGIQRRARTPGPEGIQLLGNLVCGNRQGEIKGVLLDATDEGNLTPTGTEGPGVEASPGCDDVEAVFAGVLGEERAVANEAEDFRLAEGSPAIDAGVALVEELPEIAAALLRADLMRNQAVRPLDGDDDGDADYDIGAIEEGDAGEPTPSPSASPTATPSPTPTPSSSPTPTPTPTSTPVVVPTETPSPTPSPSPEPTADPTPTPDPIPCLSCDACDTGIPGICSAGHSFCNGEFAEPECRTTIEPRTESCGNQVDEDCDGEIDEGGVPEELPTSPPQTGVFVEPLGTTINFLVNGGSAVGLASGDFDQDGVIDLAVGEDSAFFNGRRISIVLGSGDGTFSAPTYHQYPPNVNVNAVLSHDFDRDGPLDLLVPMAELQQVYFYRGDGNGDFAEPVASSVGGRAGQIQTADVNCDGVLDVAAIIDATHVTVAFGNGDGIFAAPTSYTFNHNLVDLALADVNGDGHPDLVTGSHEFAPTTGIGVRLNDGAGQFGDLMHTPGQSVPDQFGNHGHNQVFGIQIADFDGDTVADVVASTQGPSGCFMFMKGNGNGTFALPDLFDGVAHLDPSWNCVGGGNLGRRYTDNVAPDVNADGKPDVIFTYGSDDNRVVIGISRGDGTFEPSVFAASAGTGAPGSATFPRADGAGVSAALVADVNGDCMLDVVTAGFQTNASQGRMGVLLARAPGDFHAPRLAPLLRDPTGDNGNQMERGVTVGDFDNDGNPDFAAGVGRAFFSVPGAGMGIDIFEGDGDGRGKALPFTLNNYGGTGSGYLRTADFDQDGFLDFVFQGGDGPFGSRHSVSTVFGQGDFTFIDRQSAYSPRLDANQVAIRNIIVADFDDDDDPDVAALVDDGGGTKLITTFRNARTRTPLQFVSEVEVGQGSNGRGLVAADFDGDDILDMVAQDSGFANPQRVRFFKGNGDLTFEPGVSIVEMLNQGAASAEDLAAADLDEDGDQDLVMAQFFHACAYVLLGHDDGTFDAPVCYPVWTGRTNRLAIADFDVDGSLDIVVGVEDGGLYFVRGRGDGTFENGQPYAIGRHVTQVVNVADFNRDGRPDLLWSFNNANFGHSIVLSNPTGAAPTPTPAPTLPPGVTPTPSPQPTASPSPSPSPSPRATASPPADLESIVVEPVDQIILAGDTQAYTATGIRTDGTSLDLTNGVAWSSSTPGVATISGTGTATGVAGGQTTISAAIGTFSDATTLTVGAPASDFTDPTAAITAPAANSEVTAPVDVIGTATDPNFLKYELEIAPAGETTFTLLERGSAPVSNGVLGRLDPTLLLNDQYDLRLTVFDRGGNTTQASVTVQVARDLKVGLFSVAFEDLSLPLSGIPITISRIYDSRDKGRGDFGIGWRMDIQTLRVRPNREQGSGWRVDQAGPNFFLVPIGPHTISLILPGGKVEAFDLVISPSSSPFVPFSTVTASYAPRPGTLGRLALLDNNNLLIVDPQPGDVSLLDDTTLNTFDPKRFRYIASDGQTIDVDRTKGVERLAEPNGNTLTFGPSGIVHSSGKSVSFVRDADGRITQITDPRGNTQLYAYDARGDLLSHTDSEGNPTRFKYNRHHGLLEIIDPLGRTAARNEYDENGRLIAVTDTKGNRVAYAHDLDARQEVVTDRLGRVSVVEYDDKGNVLTETNPLGETTTYTYDDNGNELSITDPLGRETTFTYDAKNNLTSVTDPLGRTEMFTYDANGNPLTATDALGHTVTNTYDADGNLLTQTDPMGRVTTLTYDGAGNPLTTTDALDRVSENTYDGAGNRTTLTGPLGTVTTFTHDGNGNVLTQDGEGTSWGFTYDKLNRPTLLARDGVANPIDYDAISRIESVTAVSGEQVDFTYDDSGQLKEFTSADGMPMADHDYDAEGNLTSETDPVGNVTRHEYDGANRRTLTTFADGTTELRTYDAAGQIESITDRLGRETLFGYDDAGQQTSITDALGGMTTMEYDDGGRIIRRTDALGRETEFTYDDSGRLLTTTHPDGSVETRTYDDGGRLIEATTGTGTMTYEYDDEDRLTAVTDALGKVTTYEYDAGLRVASEDANGGRTVFSYDARGRPSGTTYPAGGTESATYDDSGRVLTTTNGNGEVIEYGYDARGRRSQVTLPGGVEETYTYTDDGLVSMVTDARGLTSFAYDTATRLLTFVIEPDGRYVRYEYDDAGNRTLVAHAMQSGSPEEVVTYEYDDLDRMVAVDAPDGRTTYTYDAVGNRKTITRPNGTVTTFTYDGRNRITKIEHKDSLGTLLAGETYTLDGEGNREVVQSADGSRVEYDYDATSKVISEQHFDTGGLPGASAGYVYDDVGNLIERTGTLSPATFSYDANNQLLSGAGVTYTYDDAGNLISETTGGNETEYDYDVRGRLVEMQPPAGAATTYTYDFRGMRVGKSGPGGTVDFLLDRTSPTGVAQVIRETDAVGATLRSYVYGLDLLAQRSAGAVAYYHADALGSIRLLTDTAGVATDSYDYSAYGTVLAQSGLSSNPYQFAGEARDQESGLTYLRARYYDPDVGRFLSRDPAAASPEVPLSQHEYLYAHGNPVNFTDPSGRSLLELMKDIAIRTIAFVNKQLPRIRRAVERATEATGEVQEVFSIAYTFTAVAEAQTNAAYAHAFFGPSPFHLIGQALALGTAMNMAIRDTEYGLWNCFNHPGAYACVNIRRPQWIGVKPIYSPPPFSLKANVYLTSNARFLTIGPTRSNLWKTASWPGGILHEYVHITLRTGDIDQLRGCPKLFTIAAAANVAALPAQLAGNVADSDAVLNVILRGETGIAAAASLTTLSQPDTYRCFMEASIIGLPASALLLTGEPPAGP